MLLHLYTTLNIKDDLSYLEDTIECMKERICKIINDSGDYFLLTSNLSNNDIFLQVKTDKEIAQDEYIKQKLEEIERLKKELSDLKTKSDRYKELVEILSKLTVKLLDSHDQ